MIIDGKKIAQLIQNELKETITDVGVSSRMGIIYVGNNPVIDSFIRIKKKFGESIGVSVEVYRFDEKIAEELLIDEINTIISQYTVTDGLIVQLPLPNHINQTRILNSIPTSMDIDVLSEESFSLFRDQLLDMVPPVLAAIQYVLSYASVDIRSGKVVLVGLGRLVGIPTSVWLDQLGVSHTIIEEDSDNIDEALASASIIITGAGDPHFITPSMVSKGVVVIDAGTSGAGARVLGDCDPAVAQSARLFTPTPGGLGPLTVAMLFRNLVIKLSYV